jgi:methyl acetate hydrolase
VLEQAVVSGAVPNVVAIAADRDGIIYEGAVGPRVSGQQGDVAADTHYRVMPMTKMVATVAALQLMEEGKLDLDAPIEEYCPEFAKVQVLERLDGDKPVLRPPASKATVKNLITHTAGLGCWFWNATSRPGSRRPAPLTCSPARKSSSTRQWSPTRERGSCTASTPTGSVR